MKFLGKKTFRIGRLKAMVAGGVSTKGQPYIYGGVKSKGGLSAGASVGTEGKQVYFSKSNKGNQARIKHNLTSGNTQLRLRKKKAHY